LSDDVADVVTETVENNDAVIPEGDSRGDIEGETEAMAEITAEEVIDGVSETEAVVVYEPELLGVAVIDAVVDTVLVPLTVDDADDEGKSDVVTEGLADTELVAEGETVLFDDEVGVAVPVDDKVAFKLMYPPPFIAKVAEEVVEELGCAIADTFAEMDADDDFETIVAEMELVGLTEGETDRDIVGELEVDDDGETVRLAETLTVVLKDAETVSVYDVDAKEDLETVELPEPILVKVPEPVCALLGDAVAVDDLDTLASAEAEDVVVAEAVEVFATEEDVDAVLDVVPDLLIDGDDVELPDCVDDREKELVPELVGLLVSDLVANGDCVREDVGCAVSVTETVTVRVPETETVPDEVDENVLSRVGLTDIQVTLAAGEDDAADETITAVVADGEIDAVLEADAVDVELTVADEVVELDIVMRALVADRCAVNVDEIVGDAESVVHAVGDCDEMTDLVVHAVAEFDGDTVRANTVEVASADTSKFPGNVDDADCVEDTDTEAEIDAQLLPEAVTLGLVVGFTEEEDVREGVADED
jgi:hypothetical protein